MFSSSSKLRESTGKMISLAVRIFWCLFIIFLMNSLVKSNKNIKVLGKAEEISWISKNNTEEINVEALKSILRHPEVENRKLFVVTVTGPSKTGKSFLLDYCLRYLYANVSATSRFNLFTNIHSFILIFISSIR